MEEKRGEGLFYDYHTLNQQADIPADSRNGIIIQLPKNGVVTACGNWRCTV